MLACWGAPSVARTETAEDSDAAFARSLQEQEDAETAQRIAAQGLMPPMGAGSFRGMPGPGAIPGMPGAGGYAFGSGGPGGRDFGGSLGTLGGSGGFSRGLFSQGPPLGSLGHSDLVPPSLDRVESPHVACEIGDRAIEMLVDTGAQCSVISMPLVQQLNLQGRLDSSQQGVAMGVGQAQILGRLRGIPVKMGHVEFSLDFSVLGIDQQLLILGVDQMRRFRCVVDLDRQMLFFGGREGCEVPFLPEPEPRMPLRSMGGGGCPQM